MVANAFSIALLPGDGIGPEVMSPCLEVLAEAERIVGGFSLSMQSHRPVLVNCATMAMRCPRRR